jgi:hypothetical protein
MTSVYIKCDSCPAVVDRYPKDQNERDGTFGKLGGHEAAEEARRLGWIIDGQTFAAKCPECRAAESK